MNNPAPLNIAITVVVLALLLARQLTARPLRDKPTIGVILVVFGLVESARFFTDHHPNVGDVALMVLSLAIGSALAAVRALFTIRIWSQNGRPMRQGNALTAVLWLVSLGQHLLTDQFVMAGAGTATILCYFGVVLIVQRAVLLTRARRTGLRHADVTT
ncbi:hypothetical protein [Actinophytocola oryzae]|uniref:DUF1453 domain-containing protein n=1 Tax=Actinophytocola oryzae TaxID=502181 RepID=A0A4R7V3D1_9PSEU|nr:hypothetical protein [Actinophytocola oryzae]TDV43112.1 hypothetical protein CLV71_11646 [Actinophytocola oryzae]